MEEDLDISNIPDSIATDIVGMDNDHIAWRIIRDMMHSLTLFEDDDPHIRHRKAMATVEMLKNLAPQDALEAQMIAQIVCAHNIATETMQHAINPKQSPQGRVIGLKLSAQFMTVFRDHMRALIQYRGTPQEIQTKKEKQVPKMLEVFFVSPDGTRRRMPRHGQPWPPPESDTTLPAPPEPPSDHGAADGP